MACAKGAVEVKLFRPNKGLLARLLLTGVDLLVPLPGSGSNAVAAFASAVKPWKNAQPPSGAEHSVEYNLHCRPKEKVKLTGRTL